MKKYLDEGLVQEKFDPEKYNDEILEKLKEIFK